MHILDVVTGMSQEMILHRLPGIQNMTNLLEHLKVQLNTKQEYGPDHSHPVLMLCLIPKQTRELLNGDQIENNNMNPFDMYM